jgi:cell division protein FtsZ
MNTESNSQPQPGAQANSPSLKIFGVGTAGINIVSQMMTDGFSAAEFIAVNTDAVGVAGISRQIHLESSVMRGCGTGGDPERGQKLAEEHIEQFKESCAGASVVFIVAGLGGGTGSGVSPVLARAARESGALVLAFVTLPFECEGNRRAHQAQEAMGHLRLACDGVICLPNQKTSKLLPADVTFAGSFRASSNLLIEGAQGIWRLMMHRGIVQIHFDELAALLKERHGECAFASVETAGENRVEQLVENLYQHPLLDGTKALEQSAAVLVSILGGSDLSMADVNRVMQHVNVHAPEARVIMGAAVDESFSGRLAVTMIAASRRVTETAKTNSATRTEVESQEVAKVFCGELLPQDTVSDAMPPASVTPVAPKLNLEQREEIISKRTGKAIKPRKHGEPRMRQITLPLDMVNKGRFDKSEPTIHKGEDLDLPTYVRRGVSLN